MKKEDTLVKVEAGIASFYTAKIRQGLFGIHSFVRNQFRFRGILLLCFLCTFLIQPQVYGQSGLCDPTVPFFQVDLTGQPNGTYISPLVSRNDNCCGTSNPDRCIEFEITLDPATIAINFTIAVGAVPSGSMFYQINCGPQVAVGTPVCLSGPGPHTLTFCKPGNNPNAYGIFAIPGPSASGEDLASPVCPARLIATGFNESTLVWHDITSGTGAYDAYLSQTTGNDTVYVTPTAGFPPYVDYQVCGAPIVPDCYNTADFCDTLRVYFYQNVSVQINPNPAGFCAGQAGVNLTGTISDGIGPYTFEWHNAANGGGSIVDTTSLTYYATAGGTYSLVVYDSTYPHCPPAVTNVIVTEYPNPSLSIEPLNPMICIGTPLNLTASGADNYLWSPATGLSGTTGATVTAMPPSTTTYTIIGWNNGPFACADTIYTTFTVLPLTEVSAGPDDTICFGGSTQLNATGGDIYVWTPATGLSNPNIADPIASPAVTTTYIVSSASFDGQVIGNGDFTQGNTGFSSDYTYQFNLWPEGYYYVGTNPNSNHPNWSPCGDHTTGSGNMMIVNGAPVANQEVWCKTVDITPNTNYAFSTWLASVHPDNPAVLQFSINGILLGSPFNASGTTCQWQQFYAIWNSGSNTTAQICIVNQNIIRNGNDFALDDIFFTPICEDLDTVTVFVSNITHTITGTDVNCFGGNNGTASVSVSGGFEPYSYQWSNGATTPTLSGLSAGTYCVTVTDASACTETACITINQPTLLTSVINLSTNVSCFGGNNGAATVTASGGTVPYSYLWSNGANTAAISGLSEGTYNVTITDALGCTAAASVIITEPTLLTSAISASANVSCFGGNNGAATVTANGGTTPYSYLWSNSANTAAISGLTAGAYNVTVTDALGCTATASVIITEPTLLTSAISASTNVSCFGGNNGAATVTANGGTAPYLYLWSNGATNAAISGLTAGTYNVTITDGLGCTATSNVIITEPTLLTAVISSSTNVSCFGGNNGSATVTANGGTTPYSYLWSNGANTAAISGLTAGSYNVTVTDALGCTATSSVIITEPTLLTSAISASSNVNCFGGNNGAATVTANGGTTPYSYLWSNGANTAAISGLTAGTYNVTVTDALGCTSSASVIITEPTLLTSGISTSTNVSCFGGNNGAATVTANGGTTPYSYLWSNGAYTATISGLTAGTYNVSITDALGCTSATSVIITEPTLLTSAISASTNVSCFGGNNGSATITANGGTPPYSYLWSNNANTATITGLVAGVYNVTITDALGCTSTSTNIITEPPLLTIAIFATTDVSCNGGHNGAITSTTSGGTPSYQYLWSNSQTSDNIDGLTAGTYTVTVTDHLGCTAATSALILEPPVLVSTITSSSDVACFGGNNGSATVTTNGGTPAYTYAWSNGSNTPGISGLVAGTYQVTVTDNNNCQNIESVSIFQPTPLTAGISNSTNIACYGGNTGSATANGSGGTLPYQYLWSNGVQSAINGGLTAGAYNVIITDQNGCTATAGVVLTQPDILNLNLHTTNVICFGGNSGTATVNAVGGVSPYEYLWTPTGATTQSISNLNAATYTSLVTDANGCTASASAIVAQPPQLYAQAINISPVSCYGGTNGSATIDVHGGIAPYTYLWVGPGYNTPTVNTLNAGMYSVIVTDANFCNYTVNFNITQPAPVTIGVTGTTTICQGSTATLTVVGSGGTAPYTFTWDNGMDNGATQLVSPQTTTDYHVTVTDALGCTSAPGVITVTVFPGLQVILNAPNLVCEGSTVVLSAIGTGGNGGPYTFSWNNGITASTASVSVHPELGTTVYIVGIADGCGTPMVWDTLALTATPNPSPHILADNLSSCTPYTVNFQETTQPPYASYLWTFGDMYAGSANTSTEANPSHYYSQPGIYTVGLTVVDSVGCSAIISYPDFINIYGNPTAAFTWHPETVTIADPHVEFNNESIGGYSYNWDFGDPDSGPSNVSTIEHPSHDFTHVGTYDVWLVIESKYGCKDSTMNEITILDVYTFYAPNAFTPNDDGVNDYFIPQSTNLDYATFDFFVIDRWGEIIYETHDPNAPWDGRAKSSKKIVQQDVYTWVVYVNEVSGKRHQYIGHVTVVR